MQSMSVCTIKNEVCWNTLHNTIEMYISFGLKQNGISFVERISTRHVFQVNIFRLKSENKVNFFYSRSLSLSHPLSLSRSISIHEWPTNKKNWLTDYIDILLHSDDKINSKGIYYSCGHQFWPSTTNQKKILFYRK